MATMEVTASGAVPAPAETTWALLCDTSRYAEWVAGTDAVTRTDGPAAPGSTYDEVNPIAGPWKGRSHWTVTTFEAPRRQVHRGEGIAPTVSWMEVEMAVAPVGDTASEVTLTLRGESAMGPAGAADDASTARTGGRGQPQDRPGAGRARSARGADGREVAAGGLRRERPAPRLGAPVPADRLEALQERTRYAPAEVEARVFARWEEAGVFSPEPAGDGRRRTSRSPCRRPT